MTESAASRRRTGNGTRHSHFRPRSRCEAPRRSSRVPTPARFPATTGTNALRTCTTPVPASGAGAPGHLLRPNHACIREARTEVLRRRRPGPQPEGGDAPGPVCPHGRGGAGLARGRRPPQPGQSGRPLHDRARLLQQLARARECAANPRRGGAEHAQAVRRPQAARRSAGPVSGPLKLRRRGRADLAGGYRQGRRDAKASRVRVP